MTGNDIGSLAYLALLGAALIAYYLAANRADLGRTLRQAMLWGLIFVGVAAAAGLWSGVRDSVVPRQSYVAEGGGRIEAPLRADGHYHLTLGINGTDIDFIVDTGASEIVLSRSDARRAGLSPDELAYVGQARTANGTTPIAGVMLDEVTLGPVTDRNVRASVNGGEMAGSLLGMSYLDRFARIEIADDRLILER
ncbi:aspartyl protease family protein [Tranquillimonas rosea]|uniref:Aspartyl protease family protein n=1 Tax=Tranquillimonas rosea TaxID=641238 RepID=A0A1H9PIX5_9RHOB|nr:TIGR02281 family clan AA aspartic protease [Tranquillimonas rosea]SER48246.1 aspartyl protease family protein [Tranquillimonas rosea]